MKQKPTITKKQAKRYFEVYDSIEQAFYSSVHALESVMALETGIPDIEMIVPHECTGIGNASRTMELVHYE